MVESILVKLEHHFKTLCELSDCFSNSQGRIYTFLIRSKYMSSGCPQCTGRTYIYVLGTQRVNKCTSFHAHRNFSKIGLQDLSKQFKKNPVLQRVAA